MSNGWCGWRACWHAPSLSLIKTCTLVDATYVASDWTHWAMLVCMSQQHATTSCWYIDVDTLSTLPRLPLLLIPLSPCVVRDRGRRSPSGYKPFHCLAFGSAAELQSPSAGGEAGIYFHPTSALHLQEPADPLLRVDQPTLIICFLVLTYLPTLELLIMNRGHSIPPPPQMRNGGSPPAHLPSSSSQEAKVDLINFNFYE
jgi:hypothetical protein